jgi:hypothetical protein
MSMLSRAQVQLRWALDTAESQPDCEHDHQRRLVLSLLQAPAPSGATSPASLAVVMGMLAATDREMGQYQRVVEHWPAFAQPLEGAICSVLRDVLAVLLETSTSSPAPPGAQSPAQPNSGTAPDPAPAPKARATLGLRRALNAGASHSRAPSVVPGGSSGSGAPGAPCSPPVPAAVAAALQGDHPSATITVHPREAAFLNALAAFMEHVPAVEDALVAWTAEKALALARVAKSAGG